jgi:uncharacterized protein involved in exopolysaccharide biosynthesis
MIGREENTNDQVLEDEIDLKEFFYAVWEGKIFIIVMTTIVALGSIYYALSLTNYFSSESILVSRDSDNTSTLSQFSGLASIAGMGSLGGKGNSSVHKVMEIIQSREFVRHLITFEDVLPSVIAADHYNQDTQKLTFDPEIYDAQTKTWFREISSNQPAKPTYLEVHRAYGEMLFIGQDKITGLISIRVEHISPVFAKEFLTLIIKEANNLNRENDIDKSNKALSYLKIELSKTSLVEIKNSINQLIKAQLEKKMLASIHEEYTLMVLEPPFIPDKRSRPTRSMIVIFSTLLGGLLSVIFVLIRHFTSKKKH